jgi:hypothetical protein
MTMERHDHNVDPPATIRARDGWAVDSVVLSAPSGRALLTLTVRAAAPGADAAAVGAQHGRELAERASGLVDAGERTLAVGSTAVVAHRFRPADGEHAGRVTYLYAVVDGHARIASLTGPDGDDAGELAAADLVAHADIADVHERMTVAYSPEELAVLAQLLGADSFPGLAAPSSDNGHASRDAARRTLLARGVVARLPDGAIALHPAQRDLLRAVVEPRTIVSAEVNTGDRRERRLVYAGEALGVSHTVTPDGVHVFSAFPARELVAQALVAAALRDAAAADRPPVTVELAELERLEAAAGRDDAEGANGLPRPVGAARLRVLHRTGKRVEGGDLRWLDAGEDGLWSVDVTDDGQAVLTPVPATAIAERFAKLAS